MNTSVLRISGKVVQGERNKGYLIIHARDDGDQYGGHRGNKKRLDPGYILSNEPVVFLDGLDTEDLKGDSQIWDLKNRTSGLHLLRWVGMGGAVLQSSLLDVLNLRYHLGIQVEFREVCSRDKNWCHQRIYSI